MFSFKVLRYDGGFHWLALVLIRTDFPVLSELALGESSQEILTSLQYRWG